MNGIDTEMLPYSVLRSYQIDTLPVNSEMATFIIWTLKKIKRRP
jgi:hypothetical protein